MSKAHCDIQTKQIYGCDPGTKEYLHEEGHIQFNSLESTSYLKLCQEYAFFFWMISVTLSVINVFMLFISLPCLLIFLGIEIYEEKWCNAYAKRMMIGKVYK